MLTASASPQLETINAFCARIGVSRRMLAKLRAENRGPVVTKIGSRVLIAPEDAAAWLESLKVRSEGKRAA